MQPDDFTTPLLANMRADIFTVINKHQLPGVSVLSVLVDVLAHCLGTAEKQEILDDAVLVCNQNLKDHAQDIFNTKTSLLRLVE